jgi:hypothetical protein
LLPLHAPITHGREVVSAGRPISGRASPEITECSS